MLPAARVHTRRSRGLALALGVVLAAMLAGARWLPAGAADPPVVQDVQPREAYPGAWVTVTGQRFGAAPGQVSFAVAGGSRRAATTRSWSDTRLQAEVPYNVVPGDVVVRTADGRTSNGFRFAPPCYDKPVIRQIVPAAAMQCQVVKIVGCGFGDFQYEQVLTFNGVDATGRVVGNWSDTELLVRVPEEVTSGPVVVTNKRRVPSDGAAFRVRDDAPEWEMLPTLGRSTHAFDVKLRVGYTPERGTPSEIAVEREHWQKVGDSVRPNVSLTTTWQSATTYVQEAQDPGGTGRYTITGHVDPDARVLSVEQHDVWDVEEWDNSSSRERKVCHHDLRLGLDLPIGNDAWDRPDFNVWAPRWGFEAAGADLGRRARGIAFARECFIYDHAGTRLRRDGVYRYVAVDWAASSASHVFEGAGKDPCRDPAPKWTPVGQIHGRVITRLPRTLAWVPEFTGFPLGQSTIPLAGVPVRLALTPPLGPRRDLALTVTGDDGRYRFFDVPLTDTLDLEVTLEDAAVAPAGFRVTYRRATGAPRDAVTLRTPAFSNVDTPLLEQDVRFAPGGGVSAVAPTDLSAVALSYAHTRQAWQTAGELGLTLDMHARKGEPLEIRAFSPVTMTFWHGDASVGPQYGPLRIPDNVHVNIEELESPAGHGDRPMNREWHEMGHHVQADIQDDMVPRYWVANGPANENHGGRLNPSSSDSWMEGFAEFYSALVERHASRHPKAGLYRQSGWVINLDENRTSFAVLGNSAAGDEEIAVASLLWDLVDSAGDEADARPMGVNQALLDAWGVQLAAPLQPADVRWPPVLYRDRIALDDRLLMFLIAEADKIAAARGVQSPNAAHGGANNYGWIFDVHQLYRTLQTMGVGQDVGATGLTALDELFVAHGFFADTAPQNLCYDRGETIGKTSNLTYSVNVPRGRATPLPVVPAWADRHAPVLAPEVYLRFDARDANTGAAVTVPAFEVDVAYEPPFDLYDYTFETTPREPGRLVLLAPDPVYPAHVRVTPRGDRITPDAPFEVTGEAYWRAASGGADEDAFRHTFSVRREPWTLAMPLVVRNSRPTRAPRGATVAPPTAPSSASFAAELVERINRERARAGRTVLAVQPDLTAAAGWYARDMAASGDYRADHSDRQGRTMPERLKALGYGADGHPRWHVAENIARGQTTPEEVLTAWMDSAVHRANVLDRDACEIGVAHALSQGSAEAYRHYWVADFGCRAPQPTLPVIDAPPGTAATPVPPPSPSATTDASPTPTVPPPSATPTTPQTTPSAPTPQASATLVPGLGIQGRVTHGGTGVAGVDLALMRVVGTTHDEAATTRTGAGGRYTFGTTVPGLGVGQRYYVLYRNTNDDATRVTAWYGPDITTYRQMDAASGGEFDIADVALLDPPGALSMWLPATFHWATRAWAPHTYRWLLYDDATRQQWTTDDLGDSGEFTLTRLPDGATYGREYWWYVRVYAAGAGYGVARFARSLSFLEGPAPGGTATPTASATPATLWVDDFCDRRSGWPTGSTATETYGYASGRECAYSLQFRQAARALAIPSGRSVGAGTPYRLTASGYPGGQGSFGLLFGMTASGDRYYVFIVSTSRSYALYRSDNGSWTTLAGPADSPAIDPDFGNSLRVECAGADIRLYVEDTLLTTVRDGYAHTGRFGVYAESDANGFEARYTRYAVESLP